MKFKHYIIILILLAVSLGSAVALKKMKKNENPFHEFRTFAQVLNIIKARYVREVDDKKLMEGAYRGAVESIFDQNSYIPEPLMERLKNRLEEKGTLGIKVMKRSGYALVIFSEKTSEAYDAGLQAGTILKAINGQNTYDMSLFEIKSMLNGMVGDKIKLKFYSVDKEEDIEQEFTYKEISEKSCFEDTLVEMKIFSINEFTPKTISLFNQYANNVEIPIIDLRYSQGKDFDNMLSFASFLAGTKMSAIYKEKQKSVHLEQLSAEKFNSSVILLTSGFSMNGAAVLAELLKGKDNITIIGTKTSGKAFESTVLKLNVGGFVDIATGFYSPMTKKGLKPDIRSFIDNDEIENAIKKYLKEKETNGKKKEAA